MAPESSRKDTIISLLRYPVVVFSIVLGLVIAEAFLEIDFSKISRISAEGIEFEKSQIQNTTGELQQQIKQLEIRLEALDKTTLDTNTASNNVQQEAIEQAYASNIEQLQTVSDDLANFSYATKEKNKTIFYKETGYIWIGDYDSYKQEWFKIQLQQTGKEQGTRIDPADIHKGNQFEVTGNLVLREEKPENMLSYFKKIERKAVLPFGTRITVLEDPIRFKTQYADHYWVKIRVDN